MAGKGDGRRTGADDKAYAEGWERIFGQRQTIATKDLARGVSIVTPTEGGVKSELVDIWDNDFNDIQEDSPQ